MKTLYDLLGVPRQATLFQLELAYRRRLDAHMRASGRPIGNKVPRQIKALRHAFLLLSSPIKRAEYDQWLVMRAQRRARLARYGSAVASSCLVVLGMALIVGAWTKPTDAFRQLAARAANAASTESFSSGGVSQSSFMQNAAQQVGSSGQ